MSAPLRSAAMLAPFVAWLALHAVAGTAGGQEAGLLRVPAKTIPLPANVSAELRKVVANPPPPLTAMPTTKEEWRAYLAKADAKAAESAKRVSAILGTDLEPVEVGGVKCYWVRPKEISAANEGKLLVHVHGGAYVQNAGLAATTNWVATRGG